MRAGALGALPGRPDAAKPGTGREADAEAPPTAEETAVQEPVLNAAALETLVSAAVAAPSLRDVRPWRLRFLPYTRTVEVRADGTWTDGVRAGGARTDGLRAGVRPSPSGTGWDGRGPYVSAGAAVLNLRVAARHLGWEPVTQVLPDPADPGLLAAVRLAGAPRTGPEAGRCGPDRGLYDAIWRRHSSRLPFGDHPVPDGILAELASAARAEGAVPALPGTEETGRLLDLAAEAEHRDAAGRLPAGCLPGIGLPALGLPGGGSTGSGGRSGPCATVPRDGRARGGNAPAPPPDPDRRPSGLRFEEHPRLLLLGTRHDRPADRLLAGQALQRVLLLLTVRGLRASVLHRALEWEDLRRRVRGPSGGPGSPQALVRIGYGPEGPTPRSPGAGTRAGPRAPAGTPGPART
ncbi:nitroreductase family protein [Streptomyces thermolineatus]|uniref:Nitroreductase family protein n=1 Tax=Streptomyces thermolineatus TaxID=44033 RepID=A0ABP5ZCP6_9ACTN